MEDIDEGVKVGGKLLKDIRFADDQAMVADSEKGLQEIMDKLVEVGRKYDMKNNVKQDENDKDFKKRRIGSKHCYRMKECRTSEQIQIFRCYDKRRW